MDCCKTCVNSCASNFRPSVVSGANCPVPKTTSRPVVKARALTDWVTSAAFESVCTRTPPKSCPKRGSKKARVEAGKGCPDPLRLDMLLSTSDESLEKVCRCTNGVISGLGWMISSISLFPHEEPASGQVGLRWMPGEGIRMIWSATRSASCSYLSFGAPILNLGWMAALRLQRGQPPPQAQEGVRCTIAPMGSIAGAWNTFFSLRTAPFFAVPDIDCFVVVAYMRTHPTRS